MTARRPHSKRPGDPGGGGPSLGEDSAAGSVNSYFHQAFIGTLVIGLLAIAAVALVGVGRESSLMHEHLRLCSGALSAELVGRIDTVRTQLDTWGKDPALQGVLADVDPAALRDAEQRLTETIPGVIKVRLLPRDQAAPADGSPIPGLSYAGIDLVRRVMEAGTVLALEAHRVNQPDEHLAIAGPVPGPDGMPLGVVHIALPLSMLPYRGTETAGTSRFHYRQAGTGSMVGIAAAITGPTPNQSPVYTGAVPMTTIEIAAWDSSETMLTSLSMIWVVVAIGVLVIGSWFWLRLLKTRLTRDVALDMSTILDLIDSATRRTPLRIKPVRLVEIGSKQKTVAQALRQLQSSAVPAPPATTTSPESLIDAEAAEKPAEPKPLELELDGPVDEHPVPLRPTTPEPIQPAAYRPAPSPTPIDPMPADPAAPGLDPSIFSCGRVHGSADGVLTEQIMDQIGQAAGTEAIALDSHCFVVSRDQQATGSRLYQGLIAGLRASGCDVIDLEVAPAALVFFALQREPGLSGAVLSLSQDPVDHHELKLVFSGEPATAEQIQGLYRRIHSHELLHGAGAYRTEALAEPYIAAVEQNLAIARPMRLVVDCGNASPARVAPELFRALGCEVIELDCDPDAYQIEHLPPDPAVPRTLFCLGDTVRSQEADLGFGFDADGDRIAVVDSTGALVPTDRLMMLLAADILLRQPGKDVIFDVACSKHLAAEVVHHGGRPIMWKANPTLIRQKQQEIDAPLAGSHNGHLLFLDRWHGLDDALYAAARVLEVLALEPRSSAEVFADFPAATGTSELFLAMSEDEVAHTMETVVGMADRLEGVEVETIDGLRAQFDQGWGLVRAACDTPGLLFRFEGEDDEALGSIQDLFRQIMGFAAPNAQLPF